MLWPALTSRRQPFCARRASRISVTRKRSASSARRWIDAFRLSINCEPIAGCASTSSIAAIALSASRFSTAKNASYFSAGASCSRCNRLRAAPRPGRASPPQRASNARAAACLLARVVAGHSARRIGERELVALFNCFAMLLESQSPSLAASPVFLRRAPRPSRPSAPCRAPPDRNRGSSSQRSSTS